ncbi:plasmid pRiA4b ORF-3 family protein [Arthrobacter sp. PAMC 25486]|uniref:plasmid pRiA4b ORF-3 family protein n=1 Tax=Arthrobacter sp. PAMC 25486 TaxID=1494608 RepID=UPI0006923BBF|nr:plasmid pRiA4b ORF-3 family protein [Arthrobacter sp. PAMC 25486]
MAKNSKGNKNQRVSTSVSELRAIRAVDAVTPAFATWCNTMDGLPDGAVQDLLEAVGKLAIIYFEQTPASDITSFAPLPFGQAMSTLVTAQVEEDVEFVFVAIRTYLTFLEETKLWTGTQEEFETVSGLFYEDDEPVFPDIDQPDLTPEQELAGLEATPLAQRMEALLRWIGPGAAVTSTGALKLKDIEAAAAAVGVAATGAKANAKREQVPYFDRKNLPQGQVPIVKSMYEVPMLAKMWAALESAQLIEIGSTKVWPTPSAQRILQPGHPERRETLGGFITNFLSVAVFGEQDWAPWVGQAAAAQAAILYAACTGVPVPIGALSDPISLQALGLDETAARHLRDRMAELAELGLVTLDGTISVPPAMVRAAVAVTQRAYEDQEDDEDPDFSANEYDPFPTAVEPAKRKSKGKKKNPNAPIYQLKVSINRASPPIWRRLLVRSDVPLGDIHTIVQNSFEWESYHLHGFQVGGPGGAVYGIPEPDMFGKRDLDENAYTLGEVLPAEGDSMVYTYDFGDNWEHLIKVEKVLPAEPQAPVVRCTGGRGRGPAEDCGGIWGWENLIEAINDPKHEEHRRYRDWLELSPGETLDHRAFDKAELNEDLAYLF